MPLLTVRQARKQKDLSQAALAKRARISQVNLSNCELGYRPLKLPEMIRVEHQLNQRLDWEDTLTVSDRQDVFQALEILLPQYPVTSVLQFIDQCLANDALEEISFYAHVVGRRTTEDDMLFPTGYGRKGKEK